MLRVPWNEITSRIEVKQILQTSQILISERSYLLPEKKLILLISELRQTLPPPLNQIKKNIER